MKDLFPTLKLSVLFLLLILLAHPIDLFAQVPKPVDVFGFEPGADYELANYNQMLEFYNQLEASSNRVKKIEIGKSVDGQPMILLFISSEENLKQLDKWKEISQKLARAKINSSEAEKLAQTGKAIIWIDGGMHANETAHGQMTPELAYLVATGETAEMKQIRNEVIFLLMPMMNPDGVNIVSQWYKKNLGTPYETSETPWLYQRYVGHDNNRDWFMGNLPETQAVMKQLYREWFPQIVYNQHQDGSTWKRMFIPPYAGPINQNIHPGVIAGVNEVGAAMAKRYALNDMPGIISNKVFSMWWNGGGRTVPYFHNQIGILTEMSHNSPTPSYFDPAKKPKQVMGWPTDSTAVFYPNPWLGGESRLRDAVDYMLTSSMATLKYGAEHRYSLLYGIYKMGRDAIQKGEAGGPFAYIIPKNQWDEWEAKNLINSLFRGGLEIEQATQDFLVNGEKYEKGSYILRTSQSFRPYLIDLLEKQRHPNRELYPGGPPERPYDLTGWTLPMQMGVKVERINNRFNLPKTVEVKEEVVAIKKPEAPKNSSYGFIIDPKSNASFNAVNILFKEGAKISRVTKGSGSIEDGSYIVTGVNASSIANLGLNIQGLNEKPNVEMTALSPPKVATYMSWMANMDEGWTRFMLERHQLKIDTLHNADVLNKDLSQFNTIIIPSQSVEGIMHGYSEQQMPMGYTGGLGSEGTLKLKKFVEDGGTLITFDEASDYAIEQFGLPVKNTVKNLDPNTFFIPGTLIRAKVNTENSLAYGMQSEIATMFSRSRAFDINYQHPGRKSIGEDFKYKNDAKISKSNVEVIVNYSDKDLLMSGWALGENNLAGKPAMVRIPYGKGQIVMFAFRPQFRDQPRASYKLIFNSIIESAQQK